MPRVQIKESGISHFPSLFQQFRIPSHASAHDEQSKGHDKKSNPNKK
jgi:hypothetical protein